MYLAGISTGGEVFIAVDSYTRRFLPEIDTPNPAPGTHEKTRSIVKKSTAKEVAASSGQVSALDT